METNGSVLVVDDNELIRRIATKLLTKNNYEVTTALNGRAALQQINNVKPDVF
jgi:CheY-like chemotaxis protein